jgi:pilus assembly protein Flp/PilA
MGSGTQFHSLSIAGRYAQSGLNRPFAIVSPARNVILTGETKHMQTTLLSFYSTFRTLMLQEEGQDLIEYALVVALIAFAATAGMSSLATSINTAFSNIGTTLTTYTG